MLIPRVLSKLIFIFWILSVNIFFCSGSLEISYAKLQHGYRLDRRMITSFIDFSILNCVEECLKRKRCKSISYYKGANYCEINYESRNTASFMYVQGSGWIYSDIEDWDKELIGPCSKANCNDNQTCQQLPFGEFKCILSDCGVPRSENVTLDAVKRWDGIGIQRRIHIKCAENYKQTGSQQFICQSNGKWRTDLICEKGCDKGWSEFENHCYYKYETSVTWQEAKEKCEKKNAYLVEVNEEKENDFLQKTFLQIIESSACSGDYTCPAWIGANDIDTEGEFIWSKSKENVRFFNWHPNEPNNGVFFNQDCAVLLHTGQWDDGTCSSKIPFICEKEL